MPFWDIRQNNSGGYWDIDQSRGIGHTVIIEATDAEDATERAELIGLYWNGVSNGTDCNCCGDRWGVPLGPGDSEPCKYGEPIANWIRPGNKYRSDDEKEYIHYMDGTFIEAMGMHPRVLRDLAKVLKDAPDF